MKYTIRVEGGFTGIPKEYQGELVLPEEKKAKVLDALKILKSDHPQLRDGLKYHIELSDKNRVFENDFNETDLPKEIREFIDEIAKKKEK